uniref:Expansin-like EG45 domain-containing protein n=1 Tax=Grammatophora oceanica TaxID=210454 RepID=A0A7S1UP23_9STRA|mmetsp:Transcript_14719/g.21655  ORF Transcript_14719/g.21655 Transcript_14719/m.21655 type:complete len:403 (+) Transcript_14719:60-1268(+)
MYFSRTSRIVLSAAWLCASPIVVQGYCTWAGTCVNGSPQGGDWCNSSEQNCLICGNGAQWCGGGSSTPAPTPNGYCTWNPSCNGVAQGGSYCNQGESYCLSCGGAAQWCTTTTTSDPPTPSPTVASTPVPTPSSSPTPDPTASTTAPIPSPSPTPDPTSSSSTPGPVPGPLPTTLDPTPVPSPSGPVENGELTWWTDSLSAVEGSSCEYSKTASIAQGSSWATPYVDPGFHCAVSDDLYDGGAGCGKCYHLVYDGVGGTNPATAGDAYVQVTNSGAGGTKHFDCFDDAFVALTGISTGIFPLSYYEVPCTYAAPTVVVLDGNNAYYVKVLVAGGETSVSAVTMYVNNIPYIMNRVSGATFSTSLSGLTGSAKFEVTFSDGLTEMIDDCFSGQWPVATSSQCQ